MASRPESAPGTGLHPPCTDLPGVRCRSDLLRLPWVAVRSDVARQEYQRQERRGVRRAFAGPRSGESSDSGLRGPRRRRRASRRHGGRPLVHVLLIPALGQIDRETVVSKDSYSPLRYLLEDSAKATKLFESPSPESVWPLSAKAPICDGPHSDVADTVEV